MKIQTGEEMKKNEKRYQSYSSLRAQGMTDAQAVKEMQLQKNQRDLISGVSSGNEYDLPCTD